MLCFIHNICNYCTCSRKLTCSASVEHGISKNISVHKYCIKHIIYTVKRATLRYHCIERISDPAACGKKLDSHAKLFCIFHICRCDLCDSFCINILVIQEFSVCKWRKDGDLTACVSTSYVCSRICLCIALCLSFLQNRIKITVLCAHLVKHVVGGSVKDSCDLIDLICCQWRIQCTNDRDTAAAACLKKEIDIFFFCDLHELGTMLGYQSLIGCAYALSCLKRSFYKGISRLDPAHNLNNNIYLRIVYNHFIIMNQNFLNRISRKIS